MTGGDKPVDRLCPLMSNVEKPVRCQREGCELYAGNVKECVLFHLAQLLDQIAHE